MGIKNRLDLYISKLGLSGREFVKICGFPEGSYSSIRDGIGANKLKEILIRFPDLSIDWLITGEGEMIKKEEKEFSSDAIEIIKQQSQTINSQQRTIEELIKKFPVKIADSA